MMDAVQNGWRDGRVELCLSVCLSVRLQHLRTCTYIFKQYPTNPIPTLPYPALPLVFSLKYIVRLLHRLLHRLPRPHDIMRTRYHTISKILPEKLARAVSSTPAPTHTLPHHMYMHTYKIHIPVESSQSCSALSLAQPHPQPHSMSCECMCVCMSNRSPILLIRIAWR